MRVNQDELKTWLTKPEAAAALNCSPKTIERKAADKLIRQGNLQMPGRKPVPVYNPEDIEKLKAEIVEAELIISRGEDLLPAVRTRDRQLDIPHSPALADAATSMAQSLHAVTQRILDQPTGVPIYHKILVSLDEAVELGFTRMRLQEMLQSGEIKNLGSPRRIRISREALLRLGKP